jgi:hypothetical protein
MHERRPRGDDQIWSAGYLPKTYQALTLDAKRNGVIDNLARQPQQTEAQQRGTLDLLKRLNQRHAEERAGQADLAARINSFELAYRMQMAAPEALDLSRESEATKKLYGLDNKNCEVFARQCLTARRLVERGVRFIQIFAGKNAGGDGAVDDVPWDGHNNIETNHRTCAAAWSGAASSGALPTPRAAWAGITIPTASRSGWPAAGSREASTTGPPTSSATRRWKTASTSTTSTRPCCISWASTTRS